MPIGSMKRPGDSPPPPPIPESFDETISYRVQLTAIEERKSSYPDKKTGLIGTYLSWHLTPYDENGVAFIDEGTGGPMDIYASSPLATFFNKDTNEKAKARQYADAFFGKELSDDEIDQMIDAGWDEPLIGKWALASFEIVVTEQGYQRLKLLKLRSLRKNQQAPRVGTQSRRRPDTVPDEDDD